VASTHQVAGSTPAGGTKSQVKRPSPGERLRGVRDSCEKGRRRPARWARRRLAHQLVRCLADGAVSVLGGVLVAQGGGYQAVSGASAPRSRRQWWAKCPEVVEGDPGEPATIPGGPDGGGEGLGRMATPPRLVSRRASRSLATCPARCVRTALRAWSGRWTVRTSASVLCFQVIVNRTAIGRSDLAPRSRRMGERRQSLKWSRAL
jgi:hypothetical protein